MATQEKVQIVIEGKDQISGTLGGIRGKLQGLGDVAKTALGVAFGGALLKLPGMIAGVGKAMGAMVADAAQVEQVAGTFDKLSASIGSTSEAMMVGMREATRGMIDDAGLMQGANKLMAMGLAESAEEAAGLSEMATQLGMAMGEDATASMENFALMLANQSIPRLDSFGISSSAVRERIEELMGATDGAGMSQGELNSAIAKSTATLDKLRDKLYLARLRQSEFTDKTSEYTRVSQQMKIDDLVKSLSEEERTLDRLKNTTAGVTGATAAMSREDAFMQAVMEQGAATMERVGEQGESTAATMARLKAQLSNVKTGIVRAFLPAVGKMLAPLADLATKIGPKLIAWAEKAAAWFSVKLTAAIDTFKTTFGPLIDLVGAFIRQLGQTESISEALSMAFESAGLDDLQVKFNAVRRMWEGVIEAFKGGDVDWSKIFPPWLADKIGPFIDAIRTGLDTAKTWLNNFKDNVLPGWAERVGTAWDTVKTKVGEWWDGTADARGKIVAWYEDFKTNVLPGWIEKGKEVWDTAKEKVGEWWSGTGGARDKIVAWYEDFKTNVLPEWKEKAAEAWDTAKEKVGEWWDGTAGTRAKIAAWYEDFKTNVLPEWSEAFKTALVEIKEYIETNLVPALDELSKKLEEDVERTTKKASEAWEAWTRLQETWVEAWNSSFKPALDALMALFGEHNTKVDKGISLWDRMHDSFNKFLSPGAAVNAVLEALTNFMNDANVAIKYVARAVDTLRANLEMLKTILENITLPDWLTPGSPTPLELGIRGISAAIRDMPALDGTFNVGGGAGGISGGAGGYTIVNNFGAGSVRSDDDIDRISQGIERALIRRGVRSFAV